MKEKITSVNVRGTCKILVPTEEERGKPGLSISKQIFSCRSRVLKGSWEQNESTDGSVKVIQRLVQQICMEAYPYSLIFMRSFAWISKIDWACRCCITIKIIVCPMWTGHSDPYGIWENVRPTHTINTTHIDLLQEFVSFVLGLLKETVTAFQDNCSDLLIQEKTNVFVYKSHRFNMTRYPLCINAQK